MTYATDEAIANAQWNAANEASITEAERRRPSVLYRPTLSADGTKWCALFGDDLASGVAGFGDTPEDAMRAFDAAWHKERTPAASYHDRELIHPDSQFGMGA